MARISPTLIGKPGWAHCTCGRLYEPGASKTPGVCDHCTDTVERALLELRFLPPRHTNLGTAVP